MMPNNYCQMLSRTRLNINYFQYLEELDASGVKNHITDNDITDNDIKHLNLVKLYASRNTKITKKLRFSR